MPTRSPAAGFPPRRARLPWPALRPGHRGLGRLRWTCQLVFLVGALRCWVQTPAAPGPGGCRVPALSGEHRHSCRDLPPRPRALSGPGVSSRVRRAPLCRPHATTVFSKPFCPMVERPIQEGHLFHLHRDLRRSGPFQPQPHWDAARSNWPRPATSRLPTGFRPPTGWTALLPGAPFRDSYRPRGA
jgi:hypothetical protein